MKFDRQVPGIIMAQAQAVLTNDHFVYTSELHGSTYINKYAIYVNPANTIELGCQIAESTRAWGVEVVVGPAIGAINLSTATALGLSQLTHSVVMAAYVKKATAPLAEAIREGVGASEWPPIEEFLRSVGLKTDKIFVELDTFEFPGDYHKLVRHCRVLVVEDVLHTGKSARKTVEAVREAGGEILGVAAICNRGNVRAAMLGVPRLECLVEIIAEAYPEHLCPLCADGIRINEEFGHGKKFLARKGRSISKSQGGG